MDENTAVSGPEQGDAGITTESTSESPITIDSVLDDAFSEVEGAEPPISTPRPGAKQADKAEESTSQETGIPQSEPDPASADILTAPNHWPKDRRDVFNRLPDHAKRAWLAQAKDAERGLSEQGAKYATAKKFAEEVDTVLKPWEQHIEGLGLTKTQAVAKLVNLYESLVRDPAGTIRFLAQQTNISPEELFAQGSQGQAAQDDEWQDPAILAVRQELNEVKRRNQLYDQVLSRQWHQQEVNRNVSLVEEMVAEADESGNPRYPYFQQVMGQMKEIIDSTPEIRAVRDVRKKFQLAYDIAVSRSHGNLMESELERRLKEQQTQRARTSRAIRPGPGSQSPAKPVKGESLDSILEDAFAQHGVSLE